MEAASTIELTRVGLLPNVQYFLPPDPISEETNPLLLPLHCPQCSCNRKAKNLLKRTYTSLFPRKEISDSCVRAQKWCQTAGVSENSEALYIEILSNSIESEYSEQIERDIDRSFPDLYYFTLGEGKIALKRVLSSFSRFLPNIGYVQGMNYLVGTLLWHASEADTFWLLVNLMQNYKLYENYIENFPGLEKHCHIIDFLISNYQPKLYQHFLQYGLITQMYATDWCFTIFTCLLPINYSYFVLGKFFKSGWIYFYKLVLEILDRLEEQILGCDNIAKILASLKPYTTGKKHSKKFVKNLAKGGERLNWKKLAKQAQLREIDENVISCLDRNAENLHTAGL
ncbi:unnamed protein product [Blepharisma stoltei]|uniref:Rab-GAP TBC domain-containing protein n=1 Tax=Blepharisma stoltei TaxID=1481888 RepID=A0AAU9K547_9CILI|nr:unnamed protein product [Blepharisma stoltei]